MKKILIVDDDRTLRDSVAAVLETEGYGVSQASDGREGLNKMAAAGFDLVLLDVVMPQVGGIDFCRQLRAAGNPVPVIMLTGKKKAEADKVLGLELGADDYLTKPFGMSELIARVHAVLRRGLPEPRAIEICAFGDVSVDFGKKTASKAGNTVHLTAKEFSLLQFLASLEGNVVSRETILNKVWGYEKFPTTRTVDTTIYNLRRKVEDVPSRPIHLVTVAWSGYKFVR
jgi:two-component system, OmpR family, response regulator VicR